ncbi:MAG: CARDB domain-containing protein, partial [Pseudomonadota bacterium]
MHRHSLRVLALLTMGAMILGGCGRTNSQIWDEYDWANPDSGVKDSFVPPYDGYTPPPKDGYVRPDTWFDGPNIPDTLPPPSDGPIWPDFWPPPPDMPQPPDFPIWPDFWPPPPPPTDMGTYAPDLVITDFVASVNNNTVEYVVAVCNFGNFPSDGYFVDIYYNRNTPPGIGEFGDTYTMFQPLAPGDCNKVPFTRNATPAGTYLSWAQVDADGNVGESDENNNVAGPLKVQVAGTQIKDPDLVISNFNWTLQGGSSVRYSVNICNQG